MLVEAEEAKNIDMECLYMDQIQIFLRAWQPPPPPTLGHRITFQDPLELVIFIKPVDGEPLLDCCSCLVMLGIRATAVGWNSEQNAVLAGDLKCLVYYILTQDEQ